MRHLIAAAACLGLLLGFALLKVFVFDSTEQPGAIALLLLLGAMILTWRTIVKAP